MLLRAVFSLTLVAALAAPASAQDRPRGVVLDFDGPGGSAARSAVVAGISRELHLVSLDEFEIARDTARSRDDLARIRSAAAELDLDVIVIGRTTGRGRRARVELVMIDATGEERATAELRPGRGRRGRGRIGAAARRALDEALAAVEPVAQAEPEPRPETMATASEPPEAETAPETGASEPRRPLLVAFAGVGLTTRSAAFALDDGSSTGYDSGAVPELALEATLHPLRDSEGLLAGVFARGRVASAVGLEVHDAEGDPIAASASRLSLDAGWGMRAGMADFAASFGVGRDTLTLGQNELLPSLAYTHLRLGMEGGVRFLDDRLRLSARAAWRPVLGAGEIRARFGADSSLGGYDVGARLGFDAFDGATVALDVELVGWSVNAAGRASTPAESGSDSTFRAMLLAGWMF